MASFTPQGLSSADALERLRVHGSNELPSVRRVPVWRRLAGQLFHLFATLLWIASALAVAAGMVEFGAAIALVVVINAVFAFAQEYRAERAAERLQSLLPHRVAVRRDGRWLELDSREVVPGDVLALAAGDLLPADVTLSSSSGVSIDTSTLTGESVPVALADGESAYAGTFLVEGEARAVVTATGADTRLARIAQLTARQTRPRTPLTLELDRLVKAVAVVAIAIGSAFFAVGALVGLPMREGFLFAIGVAVALVPEGLLPTVTLSLALGASRMARRGALVRRLEAVEALGATTFICSDKTGTLTMNQMTATEVWSPAGVCTVVGIGYDPRAEIRAEPQARRAAEQLALAGIRCSNGRVVPRDDTWVARGDPTEAALHALGLRLGVDLEVDERLRPESARFPFDPHRRRMSVLAGSEVYVKGAPDSVLPLCLASDDALTKASEMASRGLRVLAVARRSFESRSPVSAETLERQLELLGLVGLSDPPRPEVRHALAACHGAGLRVAMITGDHAGTARAIAEQVGLPASLVVTGDELPDDDAMLGALVDRDGVIACRVSPEQKLRIAKALQTRGHVVAMTGDGVNDAPALRQADVGIAMGKSGTDVARAAADLVLLDDRFETIVHAIEQGRSTFANIRRFLTYHLTDNVPELTPFAVWALSGGRFPLALGVLQILSLDLLTDQLPALALGTEPPSPNTLKGRRPGIHLVDRPLLLRAFAVLGLVEAAFSMLAFVTVLLASGWRPGTVPDPAVLAVASGSAFVAVVAGQTANVFACRSSSRMAFRIPISKNPAIIGALLVSWAVVVLLLFVPGLARLMGHAPPSAPGFLVALLAFPAVLGADSLVKSRRKRAADRHGEESAH